VAVVIVDTNVILDILTDDPTWCEWSMEQVAVMGETHKLIIIPSIYAELAIGFESREELEKVLSEFAFGYEETSRQALYLAARAFLKYRRKGGTKTSPLPDFYIGAHAEYSGYCLLSREKARYSTYFPSVHLITP
jgi:predicted nucleic acid-binding protein